MQTIELSDIAPLLRDGHLILLSTSNGDAIICDARNDDALRELKSFNSSPEDYKFRILVDSDARLNRYVREVPPLAWDIIDTSDKPLILVLPEGQNLSNLAYQNNGSIAIQMVKDPEDIKLVQRANSPLAIMDLKTELNSDNFSSIDYILNLPALFLQSSSTKKIPVIFLGSNNEVKIIRE